MLHFRKWIFPLFLFLYHLGFSWLAWRYITNDHGDAQRYWFLNADISQNSWPDFLNPGTDIVKMITFPLVKYFSLPFWSGFLIFSIISGFGLVFLYRILIRSIHHNKKGYFLICILLLLPNLHFWTSLIGKEALLFPALVLFLNEIQKKRYWSFYLFLSLLIIALIRPHVAFIVLLSYILSLLMTEKFSTKVKVWLAFSFVVLTAFFTVMLYQLQDFSGGIPHVIQKYKAHIQFFKNTDAYVSLDEYFLPYKIFTFYFRPLPFEKTGLYYQVISLENLILLLLSTAALIIGIQFFKVLKKNRLVVFSFLFILLMAVMYVYAYANYGIIMRTKIMAIPFLFILLTEIFALKFFKKENATSD